MRTAVNVAIVLLCLSTLASCALMQGLFGQAGEVLSDPEVQNAAGSALQNALRGNWIGALYNLGELAVAGAVAVKATNVVRDRRRKKFGEPVRAEDGKGAGIAV